MTERFATMADVEKTERLMGNYWEVVRSELYKITKESETRLLEEIKSYKGMVEKLFNLINRTLDDHTADIKELRKEIKSLREEHDTNHNYYVKTKILKAKK